MSRRNALFALLFVTVIFAIIATWWMSNRPRQSINQRIRSAKPQVPVRRAERPKVRTSPVPEPPKGAGEEPPVDSLRAAHAELAEALGYVAIRCYVGPELDADDYVGSLMQAHVEDGWFSDVVPVLEGSRAVERRFEGGGLSTLWSGDGLANSVDFESIFVVSWKAEAFGTTVPCTVAWPTYADITVQVVDDEGDPQGSVRVALDGQHDWTDDAGALTFSGVAAAQPLQAFVTCTEHEWMCFIHDDAIGPLEADSHSVVTLTVSVPESLEEAGALMDEMLPSPDFVDADRKLRSELAERLLQLSERRGLGERAMGIVDDAVERSLSMPTDPAVEHVRQLEEAAGLD